MTDDRTYTIKRYYRDQPEYEIVETGLTLAEAKEHCSDPESASKTATDPDLSRGPWFDGFTEE